jgi:hypothetical protein
MNPDINFILKTYLGADDSGGYEPLYRDARMKEAFPHSHAEMLDLIQPYLDEDHEPDRAGDLLQQSHQFEAMLRAKFPELDALVARALANRWHFGWSR